MRLTIALALVLASVGCSLAHERGDGDAGPLLFPDAFVAPPDASVVRPDAFVAPRDASLPPFTIAPHGPLPIVPDQGGTRMRHPQLVVITYADDPNRSTLEAHARWVVGSSWLRTVGSEYGVGTGTILGMVERTSAAPGSITGPDIEALLRNGIADHTLPVPSGPLSEALYVFYFPRTTTITDMLLGTSCMSHAGYHNETTTNDGQVVAYAVIPHCGSFDGFLSDVEQEELSVTHEVIEAATDARPFTRPAFAFSQDGTVWSPWLIAGAELADLCEYRSGPIGFVRESGFVAARVWSNADARLGDRDPCLPSDTAVPWGTLSVTPDAIQLLAAGESARLDVTAWTTMRMPAFSVVAFPGTAADGVFSPDVTLDRSSMNNGDHATLSIGVPFGTPSNQYGIAYIQITYATGDTDIVPVGVISI